jgi:hypothetical protein
LKQEQKDAISTLDQGKKSTETSAPQSSGQVSRRTFIGGLAATLGLGFLAGRRSASSTDAPTEPPAPVPTSEPLESSPPNLLDGLAKKDGSSTPPNPNLENPVPADAINSGNIYAKDASGKRPDGTYEPIDPDDPDKPYTPKPATIDGSGRGEDGSDTLPMMPRKADEMMSGPIARAETGASEERNPLPITNSDPEALPMMPKGPDADVVAQAQTGAGTERNPPFPPSENQTEPLPKMGPRDEDPVNA